MVTKKEYINDLIARLKVVVDTEIGHELLILKMENQSLRKRLEKAEDSLLECARFRREVVAERKQSAKEDG